MRLLETISEMIWIFTLMAFMLFMITSICAAGIFIIAKLIEFIKDEL